MSLSVNCLDHLVLTVADVEKSVAFYQQVLGMRVETFYPADGTKRRALRFGAQKINLHQAGEEFEPKAYAPKPGSADLCFLSDNPLSEWQAHFAKCDVAIHEGPVDRSGAQGPIQSIYIRDLDQNLIEISNLIT